MTDRTPIPKARQTEATTARLIEVATAAFARDGYAHTATEAIVALAGVTRGALYHHFGSKEGLFKAVLEHVQKQVGQRVEESVVGLKDPWEALLTGSRAFLQASLDPQVQRIMLTDAPAVLGWSDWRALDEQYSMRALGEALAELAQAGELPPMPIEAMTHLLSGAMNEAALWIAQASDQPRALSEATLALEHVLNGLRRPADPSET
ncbi:MAG TPA: TetR/AcrR family transcriptional regulator [Anaerolineales bacterium]|nr:TetR/AcrR family transcriptional regulator [Anaerolineales bacterium]